MIMNLIFSRYYFTYFSQIKERKTKLIFRPPQWTFSRWTPPLGTELILVSCGEVMMKPDAVSIENKLDITYSLRCICRTQVAGRTTFICLTKQEII